MQIGWQAPKFDGGCPITGYAVFRNDGLGGTSWTEVNVAMDSNVRDRPDLLNMSVTNFPASSAGNTFNFMVIAFNEMGQLQSDTGSYILASVPAPPTSGPSMVSQSGHSISIIYQALTTISQTGGSVIMGYNLQMDDGMGGSFTDIFGSNNDPVTSDNMILYYTAFNLIRGRNYGFRYRGRNVFGWSSTFSPVIYILAIEIP
jgi:hypothetical protein